MKTTEMRNNLVNVVKEVSLSIGLPAVPEVTEFLTKIMEKSYEIGYGQSTLDNSILNSRRIKTLKVLRMCNETIWESIESLIENEEHSSIVNNFRAFATENEWRIVQIEKELGLV